MNDEGPALVAEVSELADGIELVVFRGDIDFSTGDEASAALAALGGERRRVVVDLGGVGFIDSSGVKMLVAAARMVEGDGGVFVVCAPSRAVRRVLEILHVDQVVPVVEDRQEALAAAGERGKPAPGDGVSR